MSWIRIRAAGDAAMLLELEDRIDPEVNARAIAIAATLRAQALPGVREVVSTYRSVAVYFDPVTTDFDGLTSAVWRAFEAAMRARWHGATEVEGERTIVVPVVYGGESGPDLADLAQRTGLTASAVIARHTGVDYRVYMLGFVPGFAYMGTVDPAIASSRHAAPRLRVPSGSVGIAGAQTGIYPMESPGGWQILGRTPLRVFDPAREPACLFAPGDRVRFVAADAQTGDDTVGIAGNDSGLPSAPPDARSVLTVLSPGLFTTVQDSGRWGHQGEGVPVSGAMDRRAHETANAAVGNAADAATLEITLTGPELRAEQDITLAVAGADLQPTIDGRLMAQRVAVTCKAGSTLRFGSRTRGARAYLALAGGIDVAPVMGSRATHVRCGIGGIEGRPLRRGDVIAVAPGASPGERRETPAVVGQAATGVDRLAASIPSGTRLRVLLGPQDDAFDGDAVRTLLTSRYVVSPHSDRMGYRLTGTAVRRMIDREMISDATFPGSVQVPPSGEPILLMADRQTTGGYPQIATVISADLPAAGQLAPGDWVEFELCTRADAIALLRELRG